MLKRLITIVIAISVLSLALPASAHPGRTDSQGGHTCKTNCEKWGYKFGEWHKHNSGKAKAVKATSKTSSKKVSK